MERTVTVTKGIPSSFLLSRNADYPCYAAVSKRDLDDSCLGDILLKGFSLDFPNLNESEPYEFNNVGSVVKVDEKFKTAVVEINELVTCSASKVLERIKDKVLLNRFISENLDVTSAEANMIQREFFNAIDSKTAEVRTEKQKTLLLKSVILATNRVGDVIKREISK